MPIKDLHILPKVRDGWSYLYVEHAKVEQDQKAIKVIDQQGTTPIPCAALSLLMLGPGTTITHAAIRTISENGCMVAWTGEQAVRFYAIGMGETRSAANLLRQAELHANPSTRLLVIRRMYEMRFPEQLDPNLTLRQIRGMEGVRVRDTYAHWSRETGVAWEGRSYKQNDWKSTQPINRALSTANSCLYGVAHAAIVALGYSPSLGFIHTGKMLSFVYDVADLYKADITIPTAFRCTASGERKLELRVRHLCRDLIKQAQLLDRVVEDLERLFATDKLSQQEKEILDRHMAKPGKLWDLEGDGVEGGINYAVEEGE